MIRTEVSAESQGFLKKSIFKDPVEAVLGLIKM